MSLFPSTLTGRILDDGVTEPPVIELQGISAGQLATVLTAYTPLETSTQHTADIGTNAAAIAALQGQVAALPAAPDLTPYALRSGQRPRRGRGPHRRQRFRPHGRQHEPDPGPRRQGQPVRPGRPPGRRRRQEHAGLRGSEAQQSSHHGSNEQ